MNWRSLQPVERSASALDVSGQFTVHHASLPFIRRSPPGYRHLSQRRAIGFIEQQTRHFFDWKNIDERR